MQGDASRDGWCVELLDNGVSIELEALFFLPSLRVNRIFKTTYKDALFKIFVIFIIISPVGHLLLDIGLLHRDLEVPRLEQSCIHRKPEALTRSSVHLVGGRQA